MRTHIINLDNKAISLFRKTIKSNGVIAFPTETVYGLGVNAYSSRGVKKVFKVKGRPSDNPLIVHISSIDQLDKVASEVTPLGRLLLQTFAPGPITVVLKKNKKISDAVTAGLDTVGIRIPSHEGARRLIEGAGVPIAAPSANSSSRPSPTVPEAVMDDLNGKVRYIINGGACEIGIESTVVDCRSDVPVILRTGKITREQIAKVAGDCKFVEDGDVNVARSPGTRYRHYAPKCEVSYVCAVDSEDLIEQLKEERDYAEKVLTGEFGAEGLRDYTVDAIIKNKLKVLCNHAILGEPVFEDIPTRSEVVWKHKIGIMCLENIKIQTEDDSLVIYTVGNTVEDFTKNYYEALRQLEHKCDYIICVMPCSIDEAEGLWNRVLKTCGEA